jgi:hypothetical protein
VRRAGCYVQLSAQARISSMSQPYQGEHDNLSADCDLRHHLRSTILLLGGDPQIADLLSKSEDYAITEEDVMNVKRYNMDLIDGLKSRLTSLPSLRLKPTK